jgi:cGMP-dependent protein kinase
MSQEAALKGKTFALKGIAKAQIAELNQQEHIMNEKNVMTKLDSDFLVKLWATMKDPVCCNSP